MPGRAPENFTGLFLQEVSLLLSPGVRIIGVGGDRMADAGVELISRISSSFGLIEVIRTYRELRNTFRKAVDALSSFKPQVLVLIDYPDFNLQAGCRGQKERNKSPLLC